MKIFVTGHQGFIGVHLVDLLKQAGHTVTGCDLGLFEGCHWQQPVAPDHVLMKDVRDLTPAELEGHDAVCHLAAISNDPMGELDPNLTLDVNLAGTVHTAKVAKQAGVGRFLFSGSCSVYGKGEHLDLDETAPLNPLTAYAKSKIDAETELTQLADEGFSPIYLRNATAYGHSPMLRIDLVANNLLACAKATGQIRIMSDGSPWRPLIHCRDIALAFVALMNAPRDVVHDKAINIGANPENFQVRDVADAVGALIPSADITYTGEVGNDPRSYRVKFDLLNRLLPDFKLDWPLTKGLEELHRQFTDQGFTTADFEGERYIRLRTLKHRMDKLRRA